MLLFSRAVLQIVTLKKKKATHNISFWSDYGVTESRRDARPVPRGLVMFHGPGDIVLDPRGSAGEPGCVRPDRDTSGRRKASKVTERRPLNLARSPQAPP